MRKINQYTCQKCGASITTVEEVEGATPMMLDCRATKGCTGRMQSRFYAVDQALSPDFEWYKPHRKQVKGAMREYVKLGGLVIRPIQK